MEYDTITYDRYGTNDQIGRITLNRPEKLNALSVELLGELEVALAKAAWDDDIRIIVIRGSGRGFGAGYDLSGAGGADAPTQSRLTRSRQGLQEGARRQMFLFNLPKVTIAQVHGYCLAGSCEYAMMTDLIIAADDAKIGHPGRQPKSVWSTNPYQPISWKLKLLDWLSGLPISLPTPLPSTKKP